MSSASQGRPSGGMASEGFPEFSEPVTASPQIPAQAVPPCASGGRVCLCVSSRAPVLSRTQAGRPARPPRPSCVVGQHNDPHVVLLDARIVARRVSPRRRRETPMRGGGVTPRYARGKSTDALQASLAVGSLGNARTRYARTRDPPNPPRPGGFMRTIHPAGGSRKGPATARHDARTGEGV